MNVLTSNTGEVINKYGALEIFGKNCWSESEQVVLMCYMLESVRR